MVRKHYIFPINNLKNIYELQTFFYAAGYSQDLFSSAINMTVNVEHLAKGSTALFVRAMHDNDSSNAR